MKINNSVNLKEPVNSWDDQENDSYENGAGLLTELANVSYKQAVHKWHRYTDVLYCHNIAAVLLLNKQSVFLIFCTVLYF